MPVTGDLVNEQQVGPLVSAEQEQLLVSRILTTRIDVRKVLRAYAIPVLRKLPASKFEDAIRRLAEYETKMLAQERLFEEAKKVLLPEKGQTA